MSDFHRAALQRLIDQPNAAGVTVPHNVAALCNMAGNHGAQLWAAAHPEEAATGDHPVCCYGSALGGPEDCTCWVPVYAQEQAPARPPAGPDDLHVQPRMCGDCAYRKGSPERDGSWLEDQLMALPADGQPFWCHAGMRRPLRWEHPDGRTIPGVPDDWTPLTVRGIPYQADGSPALLCAGWAARAARHRALTAAEEAELEAGVRGA